MVSVEVIKSAIVDKEEELRNKVKTERIIERELKVEKISEDVASNNDSNMMLDDLFAGDTWSARDKY